MTSEPTTYEKNTKEQYETLGRFVEAFEMMVDEVRMTCIVLMPSMFEGALAKIVFHHGSMTAKPLFEIMRAMIAQLTNAPDNVDDDERPVFAGVLAQIAKEYNDLTTTRNNLLHGTWFVGYRSSEDSDASEFFVRKHTSTKDGLSSLDLPKTAQELADLTTRCERVRNFVGAIEDCLPFVGNGSSIERRFKFNETAWEMRPYWQLLPSQQKREKVPR